MSLLSYFDLHPSDPSDRKEKLPLGKRSSVLPQWGALFLGVAMQPYFEGYKQTHVWHFAGFWGWCVFALITSAIIFPAVYRKAFDAKAPLIVQLGPIFASGLGWQSLMGTALKSVK